MSATPEVAETKRRPPKPKLTFRVDALIEKISLILATPVDTSGGETEDEERELWLDEMVRRIDAHLADEERTDVFNFLAYLKRTAEARKAHWKAESDRLAKMGKREDGIIEYAQGQVYRLLCEERELLGLAYGERHKVEHPTGWVAIRVSKTASVECDPELVPDEFVRIERVPDKRALKAALEALTEDDDPIPGASLVTNVSEKAEFSR